MKNIKSILAFGAVLLAGCYSMDIAATNSLKTSALSANDARPKEHIVVSNYGWYLFNFIPIACGNSKPDAFFPWSFFSNQVTTELLHDRVMSYAAAQNADVRDLTFFCDKKVIFDLPGTHFPIPIPYLLCFKEVQFSGVLTHRDGGNLPEESKQKKTMEEMNQLLDRLNSEDMK